MNAKDFFINYKNAIYNSKKTKELYYKQKSDKRLKKGETPWTQFVNREIVPKLINDMILEENPCQKAFLEKRKKLSSNEYFRVDVSGWVYFDDTELGLNTEIKTIGMNWHSWTMEIAFEHENDFKDWYDEVIKLLYIDCPLRVVVGYNNYNNRNDKDKLEFIVNEIELMNQIEKLNRGEFLIIIGNCGETGTQEKSEENMIDYKGYLFDKKKEKFSEI